MRNYPNYQKKASLIIAECFQNVSRHNNHSVEGKDAKNFFKIQIQEKGISISSKNLIEQDSIKPLNERIDYVNSLSKDELKMLWKKTIREGEFSDKGGAGLGIIEMVRKSGLPIQKKFVTRNKKLSDFFMTISLPKKGCEGDLFFPLPVAEDTYDQLINKNVIVHYEGIFSQSTNEALIDILYCNFKNDKRIDSTSVRYIPLIFEVIANVSKHGNETLNRNKGFLSISNDDGQLKIHCNNFILNDKISHFEREIKATKEMDQFTLEQEYKNRLTSQELSENRKTNLGLLAIGMYTNSEFNYTFNKVDDTHSIFAMEITR